MANIQIENLSYSYPRTNNPALKRINLQIIEGEFTLLLGASGSGKSTLLRCLAGLMQDYAGGQIEGKIDIDGVKLEAITRRELVSKVSILFQNPERQIIMNKVEEEIVFGLENLGVTPDIIKKRLMEVAQALNITSLLSRTTAELSAGNKQKIALASLLVMQPEILLLDEPVASLDPTAAEEFLSILKRLNEQLGLTILMIDNNLERSFHLIDRVIVLEEGEIIYDRPDISGLAAWAINEDKPYIPPITQLFAQLGYSQIVNSVKEGRQLLCNQWENIQKKAELLNNNKDSIDAKNRLVLIKVTDLYFAYPKKEPVLNNVNLEIYKNDFIGIMGNNGAGKSTLLKTLNGIYKPQRGKVIIRGLDTRQTEPEEMWPQVAFLFQEVDDYLFHNTVKDEIVFLQHDLEVGTDNKWFAELVEILELKPYLFLNPRDLSIGMRQRVALAGLLINRPEILILDEPTPGLDCRGKEILGKLLQHLNAVGMTIIIVSHDVEFIARYAYDIAFMYRGEIIGRGNKHRMLTGNNFFVSQIGRLFHNKARGIMTVEEGRSVLSFFQDGKRVENE